MFGRCKSLTCLKFGFYYPTTHKIQVYTQPKKDKKKKIGV